MIRAALFPAVSVSEFIPNFFVAPHDIVNRNRSGNPLSVPDVCPNGIRVGDRIVGHHNGVAESGIVFAVDKVWHQGAKTYWWQYRCDTCVVRGHEIVEHYKGDAP